MTGWCRQLCVAVMAVLIALTGVSAAIARAQPAAVGMVELCRGMGTVIVPVDADGNPTGPIHLCPEVALTLVATAAAGFEAPAPTCVWMRIGPSHDSLAVWSVHLPEPQARGPPVLI